MDKEKVAEILVEIGTLLELKGENPFKTRAYTNGARTIEGLNEPLQVLVAEKRLGDIKGIGEALEQKITELNSEMKMAGSRISKESDLPVRWLKDGSIAHTINKATMRARKL